VINTHTNSPTPRHQLPSAEAHPRRESYTDNLRATSPRLAIYLFKQWDSVWSEPNAWEVEKQKCFMSSFPKQQKENQLNDPFLISSIHEANIRRRGKPITPSLIVSVQKPELEFLNNLWGLGTK
jgi:hypothetical protein